MQNHLELQTNNEILEKLPKNANLHFAKFESDYAICFDYSSKTIYSIPKSYLKGTTPKIGEPLKKVSSKDFRINKSGIPANPKHINNFLKE